MTATALPISFKSTVVDGEVFVRATDVARMLNDLANHFAVHLHTQDSDALRSFALQFIISAIPAATPAATTPGRDTGK